VIGLTKSAALEYASQGIRINSICPGLFHTAMADQMIAGGQKEALDAMLQQVPAGRLGRPEEIASAVLWLCSDGASMVMGHTLVVDGGYSIQ
jgi:NAD(P)-dependent dehydrogenase (short-subunit alcohol dehydrogenase family)